MSINIEVHGSPFTVRKQYGLTRTFDSIATSNRQNELQKRRVLRLQQVREQSKQNSIKLRKKVENERARLLSSIERKGAEDFRRWKSRKLTELEKQYNECGQETLGEIIAAEAVSGDCDDKENEQHTIRDRERAEIALQQVRHVNAEADRKIEEAVERKRLVRNIENLRSSLVTKIQAKSVKSSGAVAAATATDKGRVNVKSPAKKGQSVAKKTVTIAKPWTSGQRITVTNANKLPTQVPDSDSDMFQQQPRKTIRSVVFPEPEIELRPEFESEAEAVPGKLGHCYCRCPKSPAVAAVRKIDRALSPIEPNRNTVECQTVAQCCCMCRKHMEPLRKNPITKPPARKNPVPVVPVAKRVQPAPVPKRTQPQPPQQQPQTRKQPKPLDLQPDDDFESLLSRVREQKQRLLADAARLPENSNLDRVLDGLAELVSNRVGALAPREPSAKPAKVTKSYQTQPKIRFKSIAAQTSFSSSATTVATTDSDVQQQQPNEIANKPTQLTCEYRAAAATSSNTATQNRKILKIDQMTDVCEIVIRVRDDQRTTVDFGRMRTEAEAVEEARGTEKPRRIVRKKIYRHVSSIISSETTLTTTADSCTSASSSSSSSSSGGRNNEPITNRKPEPVVKKPPVAINPKLAGYIHKLLKMPKSKVDQLSSCSENSAREEQTMRLVDKAISVRETELCFDAGRTGNEKYEQLIEGCSQRIANLDREIEKVRLQKSKIMLTDSVTSTTSETSSSETTGLNQSTQYFDPPKFAAPEQLQPQTKKGTKPPVSLLNTKHQLLNVVDVVEAHELSAIAEVVDSMAVVVPSLPKQATGHERQAGTEAMNDDSTTSESLDSVFRSLGIDWMLPRLREERAKVALTSSTTTTTTATPATTSSTSIDDSFNKLVHRILNSISSSESSSKELGGVAAAAAAADDNSPKTKQRTSTPVFQQNDDFDYRTFFSGGNKDGNDNNADADGDGNGDSDNGNELSSIRTVSNPSDRNNRADDDVNNDVSQS